MNIPTDSLALILASSFPHTEIYFSMGIGLLGLAGAAWIRSARPSVAALYFFGWLFIAGSALEAVDAYLTGGWNGFYIHLVGAIFYGVTGYLLLRYTRHDPRSTSLIVAMYFILAGVFNIIAPFTAELPDRVWHTVAGFITLVLGPALLGYWSGRKIQMSEFRVIGILIGIDFCVRGLASLLLALRA